MVSFTCGTCNEVMKKNQVQKHILRCRTRHVACLDCNVDFPISEYDEHRKCITEEEKYQGSTYQPKVNKGEIKQAGWAALVEKAKKKATDPRVKKLLNQIEGYDNVPRKKPKFVNFVSNCAKCRDKEVAEKTFDLIKAVETEEKSAEIVSEKSAKIITEIPVESITEIPVEEVVEEVVVKKKKDKASKVSEYPVEVVEEVVVKKKKNKASQVAEYSVEEVVEEVVVKKKKDKASKVSEYPVEVVEEVVVKKKKNKASQVAEYSVEEVVEEVVVKKKKDKASKFAECPVEEVVVVKKKKNKASKDAE